MDTIMVQDTDQTVLEMLTEALELDHFQVYPMRDCEGDFMELIEQLRPHVVMLDYSLHGERCLQAFRRIKEKYPHLPVIASSFNHNIHQEYDKLGFDGYIEKPFDLDLLYRILRKYIAKPAALPGTR